MTVVDVLKSAQFVVNNKGQRTAVLLNIQDAVGEPKSSG